jgi:tetratricopeptide (TPR) repeat protein
MSQRLTRKEIKHEVQKDSFINIVDRTVDFAESHTAVIVLIVAAVVVAGLATWGVLAYFQHRSTASNVALADAIKVAKAPVGEKGPKPDDPIAPSFADAATRDAKAKQLFELVRADHSGTDAADIAGVYLGQYAADAGDLAQARELWQTFLDRHQNHALAAEVRLNLLRLDRQQGKAQEVATELEKMLDERDKPLPEDTILYELAVTREQLGKHDEALSAYQRIVDDFPRSPYLAEARQKVGTGAAASPLARALGG